MTQHREPLSLALTANYTTDDVVFEDLELSPEDIVEGEPRVENATLYNSEDGKLLVGVARLSGGTVRYAQAADEIDVVRSGVLIITSDEGERIQAEAGSVNRLSKGVVYTKQVVEPYEEVYVMVSEEGFQL